MAKQLPWLVILMVLCCSLLSGQALQVPAPDLGKDAGDARITESGLQHLGPANQKSTAEKPFSIEAVYTTTPCSSTLASIDVYNAHFPLTWYELNDVGQRVHVLFNPQLNYFNNHTTYVVEDFSKHTDTIYIEFEKALALKNIFPNPHRHRITIRYAAMESTPLAVRIYDTAGRLVLNYDQVLTAGEHDAALNLGHLEQGVYFLSLNGLCINELIKIIHLE